MHLAILRTGQTNKTISDSFPDYPEMFARLLNRSASDSQHPRFTFKSFAVFDGELPAHINDFDGYILTVFVLAIRLSQRHWAERS